jgi:8-oxo-dGTP diphosphatase
MDNRDAIEVTAAIIVEDGRVLIARRPPGGRHPGAWEFPGGKVETGETHAECLARELLEELGIIVEVGEKLAMVRHEYPDLTIDLLAFNCTISRGRPRDLACSEHAWVCPEELSGYDLLPPDRRLAEILRG